MLQRRPNGRQPGNSGARIPILAAVLAVACSGLAGAGTAQAGPISPAADPFDDPYAYRTVVSDGYQRGLPDERNPITYCLVDDSGLNCNGGRVESFTYEVNAQFGASGEMIAGQLGISLSKTVTITAGCTTDKAQPGYVLVTYPAVTRHYFHVIADNTRPNFAAQGPDGFSTDYQPGSVKSSPQLWTDTPDGGVVCDKQPVNQPPWNAILRPNN